MIKVTLRRGESLAAFLTRLHTFPEAPRAAEAWRSTIARIADAIRSQHKDWTEEQVAAELRRRLTGTASGNDSMPVEEIINCVKRSSKNIGLPGRNTRYSLYEKPSERRRRRIRKAVRRLVPPGQ